jgi:CO/xanthine dehydrogenase Mo-binding subunit
MDARALSAAGTAWGFPPHSSLRLFALPRRGGCRSREPGNWYPFGADWQKVIGCEPPPKGHGLGAHRSFVTYVATVVEVAVDGKGNIKVPRVDTAIDCGFYVNQERIRSQIERAAVMRLALAKYGEITRRNRRVAQSNFNDYQVVRHDEAPAVTNTYIVENGIEVPSTRLRILDNSDSSSCSSDI